MNKVSIIIPVFNAEKYIEECLKSALNQTYSNCEIIAVDDGSTDNSLKLLEKFSDKIKIIHKKNGGTPTALNAGIKEMSGDWFKWLSADDLLKANAVEVLVNEVNKTPDAESCIFYSNYDLIDSSTNIIDKFDEQNYNNASQFERNIILLNNFYGNGITSLIYKSIFTKYGLFDETIGFQEDYEFWLRCCLLHDCKLHLIEKNLAQYRIHESQLTQIKINESLSHANFVRNFVLSKLSQSKRTEYESALKKYQTQKPLKVKIRRYVRDTIFLILPKCTSDKILRIYMKRKKL